MKITTGEFEISDSGIIMSKGLLPITFELTKEPRFEIIFKLSLEGIENTIDVKKTEDGQLTINYINPTITNFGFKQPYHFGYYFGKEIYVNFRLDTFGSRASYAIKYTFYLKEKKVVKND